MATRTVGGRAMARRRGVSCDSLLLTFLGICLTGAVFGFQYQSSMIDMQRQQDRQYNREQRSVIPNVAIPRHGWFDRLHTRRWAETASAAADTPTKEKSPSMDKPSGDEKEPQVMSSGYSQSIDLIEAIEEAVKMALEGLPPLSSGEKAQIDLAVISVSSLYDGSGAGSSSTASSVIPTLLNSAKGYGSGIQNAIGSSSGGVIGSRIVTDYNSIANEQDGSDDDKKDGDGEKVPQLAVCQPLEQEGVPCVSVTLCILPDVNVETFHVTSDEVPENWDGLEAQEWKQSIGWTTPTIAASAEESDDDDLDAVFLLPSPAFSNELEDLLGGMEMHLSSTKSTSERPTIFGAVASTVSSLSRARLFRYDCHEPDGVQAVAGGCVGVKFSGDIEVQTVVAQGAKPVGGVYQIVRGQDSTISTVALDETATELIKQAEEEDGYDIDDADDGDDDEIDLSAGDRKAQMAALYAKARIPKPVLAEANFIMRTLSDDDQAFMAKTLLVGIERCGALGRSNSELSRLAEGKGYAFDVHPVASAAMKDGSVTLSLGSVTVNPGTKMRFFVREANYAEREVKALLTGFKARNTLASDKDEQKISFEPAGCFVFPTLDRGNKFFLGKGGFESTTVSKFFPEIPSISGFFCNGVINSLSTDEERKVGMNDSVDLIGSATSYALLGSKSNRPTYTARKPAKSEAGPVDDEAEESTSETHMSYDATTKKAPRDGDGELILKRREVHSGRAMTVSTVEWSVAEKTATPSSALEGFMWDKETEVDRFRERVPLANLLSQCKLYMLDPSKPKPRDWIGPVIKAAGLDADGDENRRFVIIPECKRQEPQVGSLRKRYDVSKLTVEFSSFGAPALAINCDAVMFGGSLDDVTKAREATSKMVLDAAGNLVADEASPKDDEALTIPPILASDLLLYPYQLYKIRLAGADAVNLVVGALQSKDLVYLTKIASSLQIQSLLMVTSVAQLKRVMQLPPNSFDGLIVSNRKLEDFSFDMSGRQALDILQSPEMESFREKHGERLPVLVDGRVGLIEFDDDSDEDDVDPTMAYIKKLEDAGATGAIVGGGLVEKEDLLEQFTADRN
eukprot:CAMPEP_0113454684 /NCGR_PEP_ID=MMETSP0014_2-20120614/7989_1 /TAXON_ID=2857 /ORGANISM="Nitzschia sp." /LENGTH=1078 /DNA_ID=CAMNT_0000346095 /DNA_START=45 /DNA_END=3281 /DNA_ORIENTATION=- /assembly_acc=CAM_ASM_000159